MWLVYLAFLAIFAAVHNCFVTNNPTKLGFIHRLARLPVSEASAGLGTIAVTSETEHLECDEFLLNLLNEQHRWKSIRLGLQDPAVGSKKLLTRTARYSGLLNILDFIKMNNSDEAELAGLLTGCDAWLALGVPRNRICAYAATAVRLGVRRALFTLQLPPEQTSISGVPEFGEAEATFAAIGGHFTGIRHGEVVAGAEDGPYSIVNATTPCTGDTVTTGVLARVATELLRTEDSYGKSCGLSSAGAFEAAYLNILRSTGLTRQQEVRKVFAGGIERVAQLTAREREAERKRQDEQRELERKKKEEKVATAERDSDWVRKRTSAEASKAGDDLAVDFDEFSEEYEEEIPEETLVNTRAREILRGVWVELNARMMSKSTSQTEFYENNMHHALDLAAKELAAQKDQRRGLELQEEAALLQTDEAAALERKQYAKLLALEQKELLHQKQVSDTWVRYLHLLLSRTLAHCTQRKVDFLSLDEAHQTSTLRKVANELRAQCGLPAYAAVYDPVDAELIVQRLATQDAGCGVSMVAPVEVLAAEMHGQYGYMFDTVPALREARILLDESLSTIRMSQPALPSDQTAVSGALEPVGTPESGAVAAPKRMRRRRNGNTALSEDESTVVG